MTTVARRGICRKADADGVRDEIRSQNILGKYFLKAYDKHVNPDKMIAMNYEKSNETLHYLNGKSKKNKNIELAVVAVSEDLGILLAYNKKSKLYDYDKNTPKEFESSICLTKKDGRLDITVAPEREKIKDKGVADMTEQIYTEIGNLMLKDWDGTPIEKSDLTDEDYTSIERSLKTLTSE
jgi:hypothetical protein